MCPYFILLFSCYTEDIDVGGKNDFHEKIPSFTVYFYQDCYCNSFCYCFILKFSFHQKRNRYPRSLDGLLADPTLPYLEVPTEVNNCTGCLQNSFLVFFVRVPQMSVEQGARRQAWRARSLSALLMLALVR